MRRSTAGIRQSGFTLIELLVAMSIFGVVMASIFALLSSNQRTTFLQQARTVALTDARGAASFVAEMISQADYIYPKGAQILAKIDNTNKTVTTGSGAVAILRQSGPCNSNFVVPCTYTGILIFIDSRANYNTQVGPASPNGTDRVMVLGTTSTTLQWPVNTLPAKDWTATGNLNVGVQAENIVAASTDLLDDTSQQAGYTAVDDTVFATGILKTGSPKPPLTQANTLINQVSFDIAVKPLSSTSTPALISGSAMARNVPRAK